MAFTHHPFSLPSLLIHLAGLATHSQRTDASIRSVKVWLDEIKQRETQTLPKQCISHLSIIELSEREHELLGFLTEYGLQEYEELVQTLLESGIVRRDLEELVCRTQHLTVLPELLSFVEFMLATEAMACGIRSELIRVSALVDAVVTYTSISGSEIGKD
jgi:hypothetical protein